MNNIILFYKIEYDSYEFYYRRINNDKSIFKLEKSYIKNNLKELKDIW